MSKIQDDICSKNGNKKTKDSLITFLLIFLNTIVYGQVLVPWY